MGNFLINLEKYCIRKCFVGCRSLIKNNLEYFTKEWQFMNIEQLIKVYMILISEKIEIRKEKRECERYKVVCKNKIELKDSVK